MMSRNVIEISSEDESNEGISKQESGHIHAVSSSSDSEVEFAPLPSDKTLSKAYKIPKVSTNNDEKNTSLEEFPSPSKLDVFQSTSKHTLKTNPKQSPSRNLEDKKPPLKVKEQKNIENSQDEVVNLDNSLSSIKSHDISDSNSDSSVSSLPSPVIKRKKKPTNTKEISDKQKKAKNDEKNTTVLSLLEEFPSPSKLDVFQSTSKHTLKTNPKLLPSRNLGDKKPPLKKVEEQKNNENSQDEVVNLDNSLSSIKSHDISDSNSDSSVSPLPSPVTKRKKKPTNTKEISDKQKKAHERLRKKKEEAEVKAKKKEIADALRKFKPGECLKHLTTRVDAAMLEESYGNDVLASLDELDTKYEIISQPLPSTITWMRDGSPSEENLVLIIWSGEHFVNLIAEMKTVDEIIKFRRTFSNKRIILVVFGLEFYMKKLMKDKCKKSNRLSAALKNISKADVEVAMIQIQLVCKCNCKVLELRADIALHVSQVTKSVAETPFRLERQKLEKKSDWHASSDSKDCVKVDRLGNGLGRLWRQQLCQFNNVTLDISEAIAQVYKTPTSLIKAYESCNSKREGEKLLADIVVRRGKGPSASTRTVGKELSKKVYYLFNSRDPDQYLSQVQEL